MAEQLFRDVVPTIHGAIGLSKTNLSGNKRIVATINGVKYTVSPTLSADLRSGKVKWDDLGNFWLRDATSADGVALKSIGYLGEDLQVIAKNGWSNKTVNTNVEVVESDSFDWSKYGVTPMDLKATV